MILVLISFLTFACSGLALEQQFNDLDMLLNNQMVCSNPMFNKVKQRRDEYGTDYPEFRNWSMTSDIISYFNTNNNADKKLNVKQCMTPTDIQLALNQMPRKSNCFIPWINSCQRCDIMSSYRYLTV